MSSQDFLPERIGIAALGAASGVIGDLFTMERGLVGRSPTAVMDVYLASTGVADIVKVEQFLDVAVRRAAAFFDSGPYTKLQRNGEIRPLPPSRAGLLLDAVEFGSYRAKHKLKGKAEQHAKEHPIFFPLVSQLFAAAIIHFGGSVAQQFDQPHHEPPPETAYVVEEPAEGATVIVPPSGTEIIIPNEALGSRLDVFGQSRRRPQPGTAFEWSWTISAMNETYSIRPHR
ncbi:MAG: hypothetical protein KGQ66_22270 [Acidobacteriota bacterium]|nr:hypothetical protein [Acidobacteriota bacterium]